MLNPDRKRIWRFLSSAPIFYSKKLIDQLTQSSNQWYLNSEKSTVNDLIDLSKRCHIDHELFYSTKILSTNSPTLRCMAISPDNRFLAVASHDKDSTDPPPVLKDSPCIVTNPSPITSLDWLSVILLSTTMAGVLEFTPPA